MIGNYWRIAWRTILRHKSFTIINVLGLSIGIAACLAIFLVVRNEWNYDRNQPSFRQIYRLVAEYKYEGSANYTPGVPYPTLAAMRNEFPHLRVGALRSSNGSQVTVLKEGGQADNHTQKFIESRGVFFADAGFFDVFSYQWLAGKPSVLNEVNKAALSRSTAEKYFGKWQDAVGRYLKLDNSIVLAIAAVFEDSNGNTDFPLMVLASMETLKANARQYSYDESWGHVTSQFQVYLRLSNAADRNAFDERMKAFVAKYNPDDGYSKSRFYAQPLSDIHFDRRFGTFSGKGGSRNTLYTLGWVGILIILMASINFINLSTAQAVNRSREIGVRKVLGSLRGQLIMQVIGETTILVLLGMLLALAILQLALPFVSNFLQLDQERSLFDLPVLGFLLMLGLMIIGLSGIYPALVMSRFKPVEALRHKIGSASVGGISLRRALVVLQFAIAQVLVIGTIIAIYQTNHLQQADLGFNKDALLMIKSMPDSAFLSRQKAFKQALLRLPGVMNVAQLYDAPSSRHTNETNFSFNGKPDEAFGVSVKYGDADYVKTFGLKLLAGHAYKDSDTGTAFIVNETLMKKLGISDPNEMLGKSVRLSGGNTSLPITAVARNFASNTLYEPTKPLLIVSGSGKYVQTAVKVDPKSISNTLLAIQQCWNQVYPDYVYSSSFLDEDIARFYVKEEKLSALYRIFSALAIFISCLGLYGLVSFMAVQRTREIGIRKVLGATVPQIVYLFAKEFNVLLLIAFIISAPLAYLFMSKWLNQFAYRIDVGIGIFVLALLVSCVAAWLAVGYKALRASLNNPVRALRSE